MPEAHNLIELLIFPFRYQFMQYGLLASILVGLSCSLLGVYVVLRRMAFIGDAMAHTALPGVVAAWLSGWSLFGGAVLASLLTALGISWFSRKQKVREDTAIGILFTAMFALGVLMVSFTKSFRDFSHILFGNILALSAQDLLLCFIVTVIVILALLLLSKELELSSVDPSHAKTIGLSPDLMRTLLLLLLALTVSTGIQAVGVVLTSALLVTPAAAASLLTKRLGIMMLLSSIFAIISGIVGLYASFYFNVSSGAAIVLSATFFFVLAWIIQHVKKPAVKTEEALE